MGFHNLKAFEVLLSPLSFALQIVANLLCSCLCLFDEIVELHPLNEKMFNDFLMVK